MAVRSEERLEAGGMRRLRTDLGNGNRREADPLFRAVKDQPKEAVRANPPRPVILGEKAGEGAGWVAQSGSLEVTA